jgi:hypothetical protein
VGPSGADNTGSVSGVSKSGTVIVGSVALAAGIRGSLLWPANAGVTELAPSAAQISSAVRNEGNIISTEVAVNHPNQERILLSEYYRCSPPG